MSEAYERYQQNAQSLTNSKLRKEIASMRRYLKKHADRHFQESSPDSLSDGQMIMILKDEMQRRGLEE